MSVTLLMVALVQTGQAVPTPRGYPKDDFVGGPLAGLMSELRGEKTQLPPKNLSDTISALFEVGSGTGNHDLTELTVAPATQSYVSRAYPHLGWSGKIESGFLKKFEGCSHTSPWFDGTKSEVQRVHFYWSCDKANPYLTKTVIRFVKGKVQSWEATDFPPMPIVMERTNG